MEKVPEVPETAVIKKRPRLACAVSLLPTVFGVHCRMDNEESEASSLVGGLVRGMDPAQRYVILLDQTRTTLSFAAHLDRHLKEMGVRASIALANPPLEACMRIVPVDETAMCVPAACLHGKA